MTGRRAPLLVALATMLAACGVAPSNDPYAASPWAGRTPSEVSPVVVALCHGANQRWPENFPPSYFEAQFSETQGSSSIADYWRDVSGGRFSIDGSVVLQVQVDASADEIANRRVDDWGQCRDALRQQNDVDLDAFVGLVVIKPQTQGALVDPIGPDHTRMRVRPENHSTVADWPTPPFELVITRSDSSWRDRDNSIEYVRVTAATYDGDVASFTIERAQGEGDRATTAKEFDAGTPVVQFSDVYGEPGRVAVAMRISPTVINHEFGHLLGWRHSRKLSTASAEYGDCFDVMSANSCVDSHYFEMSLGYAGRDVPATHGIGLTSGHLDLKGWIDDDERRSFDCGDMASHELLALGLDGEGVRQVRVPVSVAIREGVTSVHLTLELRSSRFAWDRGIPGDAVVAHLVGDDGIVYHVDGDDVDQLLADREQGAQQRSDVGGMTEGDELVLGSATDDLRDDVTITVDEVDVAQGTAQVTLVRPEGVGADCGGASTTTTTAGPPPGGLTGPAPGTTAHHPYAEPVPGADPDEPEVGRVCFETPDGKPYPFPLPDGAVYVGPVSIGYVHRYIVPSFDAAQAHIEQQIAADPDHVQIDDPGVSLANPDLRDAGFTLVGPCYDIGGGFALQAQEDGSISLDVFDLG